MAFIDPDIEEMVAGLPEVQARVSAAAEAGAVRIRTVLVPHTVTGRLLASVDVTRSIKGKDRWINVSAPYVVPANYGFYHVKARRFIHGIHFVEAAAGGA